MSKLIYTSIKCCNPDTGVFLLDDIKNRLNERILTSGSICKINKITSDNHTWITITIDCDDHFDDTSELVKGMVSYIQGLVSGILIWSGVEVI